MKLRGALSVPRDKIAEFGANAMTQLVNGLLEVTKLNRYQRVRMGFAAYLKSINLQPTDDSVMAWLQENPGPVIGAFILETDDGKIDFRVTAGTEAELKEIGNSYVEESNRSQRSPGIG